MTASVQELYGRSLLELAREVVESPAELERRRVAGLRSRLLRGDGTAVLQDAIKPLYSDAEVYRRVCAFARFTNSQALFRRGVKEMARPVYAIAPTRTIAPAEQQQTFADIVRESRLNARMALGLEFMVAHGDAALFDRWIPSLARISTCALEANSFSVIQHPDDPSEPVAYIYDREVNGEPWRVIWDGRFVCMVDKDWKLKPFKYGEGDGSPFEHGLPRLPFTPLHLGERSASFWEPDITEDLLSGDLACRFLYLIGLRVLKTRGFPKYKTEGDGAAIPKDQLLDEENALHVEDGARLDVLNDQTDAAAYLDFLRQTKEDVAANRGISRARLNRDNADASSDVGLLEVRSELVATMAEVEQDHFESLKAVSVDRPDPLTPDAEMVIDFGEWELRTDRKSELEVFQTEESLGVANVLDLIAAKNPEANTEEKQWAEFDRNTTIRSRKVEKLRALNMSADGSADMPGQNPQQNGRLGPPVRDGQMSKDEAAEQAESGSE